MVKKSAALLKTEDKPDKPSLKDSGTYLFTGYVDESSVKPCIEWILESCLAGTHKELTLVVSSGGGYVNDCFALIDVMRGSAIPINTLGLGCIASCGLTIFLFGKKRVLTENTFVLSHQYSAGVQGKHHELFADRKAQDWMHERLTKMYMEKTGLSRKQVEKHLLGPSDSHLSAEECLDLGICHEVK
jgi:ATP-dependent protease ClpP protease subunit